MTSYTSLKGCRLLLVDKLPENPDQLNMSGALCEMTIMMSHVPGFTTLSWQFPAEKLVEVINPASVL